MTARSPITARATTLAGTLASTLAVGALATITAITGSAPPATATTAASPTTPPRTHLTLAVTGCNGCQLRLTQALEGRQHVWQSGSRTVRRGSASWTIPTRRTHGLSITVLAPWDGGAGYVPTVAFRYAGERVGDRVTAAVARTKRRASACWAGTPSTSATIAVTVVHARSTNPPGDPIRTPRAFTTVTQAWDRPMYRAWHGISGTQEATYCR